MADGFQEITQQKLGSPEGLRELNRMLQYLFLKLPANGDNVDISYVYGTPEGALTKNIGALALRLDGGASTTLYVKTADNGLATGWTAK